MRDQTKNSFSVIRNGIGFGYTSLCRGVCGRSRSDSNPQRFLHCLTIDRTIAYCIRTKSRFRSLIPPNRKPGKPVQKGRRQMSPWLGNKSLLDGKVCTCDQKVPRKFEKWILCMPQQWHTKLASFKNGKIPFFWGTVVIKTGHAWNKKTSTNLKYEIEKLHFVENEDQVICLTHQMSNDFKYEITAFLDYVLFDFYSEFP